MPDTTTVPAALPAFVQRWSNSGGAERANYQLFLTELCDLLAVPHPNPAVPDNAQDTYTFDRAITVASPTPGPCPGTPPRLSNANHHSFAPPAPKAHAFQGVGSHRPLHPRRQSPFLLVVDVGYSIETYSDFSGLGKTYTSFPDSPRAGELRASHHCSFSPTRR